MVLELIAARELSQRHQDASGRTDRIRTNHFAPGEERESRYRKRRSNDQCRKPKQKESHQQLQESNVLILDLWEKMACKFRQRWYYQFLICK